MHDHGNFYISNIRPVAFFEYFRQHMHIGEKRILKKCQTKSNYRESYGSNW